MNSKISSKISNANVLFTICIVFLHSRSPHLDGIYSVIGTITDAAVPMFFAMSSYLYFYSFRWDEAGKSYVTKIKRRCFSLLIPYIIFSVLGAIVVIVKGTLLHKPLPFDSQSASSIIGYILSGKGNPPLWYLTALFQFTLIAPIVGYIVRLSKWSIMLIPLSSFFCYQLGYSNILFWIPNLIFGCYCCYWMDYVISAIKKYNSLLFVGSIVLFICFCCYFYNIENRQIWPYYIYRVCIPIIVTCIYSRICILPPPIVDLLKPFSLFIYCTHSIIIHILSPILKTLPAFAGYTLKVLATIIVAYCVGKIISRYFPRVWSVLVEGR